MNIASHTKPLHQLLTAIPGLQLAAELQQAATEITSITDDSRQVQPGSIFVAYRGVQTDGHKYIAGALQRGAAVIICEYTPTLTAETTTPIVLVPNGREAFAWLCAAWHNFPSRSMTLIGVTGTDGKTTTSTLIYNILKAAPAVYGYKVGLISTVNAVIGDETFDTGLHTTTPDADEIQRYLAQMRDAGTTHCVLEVTSHGLAHHRVDGCEFDLALVTNITHEHLDEHGSREAYVAAKALLFRALYGSPSKPGIPRCAVLNADDDGSFDALQTALAEEASNHGFTVPVRTYGIAGAPTATTTLDVVAEAIEYLPSGTQFRLRWWGGEFSVNSNLIGEFNVANVLCAATVALALGLDPAMIQQGISNFAGVLGRMERIDAGQSFLAVVDFAHSPVSLERALITLRKMVGQGENGQPGRLIAVFGSAGLRDVAKRRLMGRVSGRLADFTVVTAEDPRTEDLDAINAEIAAGVEEFAPASAYTIVPDRAAAIQCAVDMARPGDIVASFGKGHERSMCFGETEYPWSDQDAMHSALKRRLAAAP